MDDSQITEIDIRGILGLLRRQIRLIISTILIVLGIATITLFTLKPIYTSTALVLVDPNKKNLLDTSVLDIGGATASARIDSEVEILKANSTLLSAIETHGLVSDEEFGVKLDRIERLSAWLRISEGRLPTGDQALQGVLTNVGKSLQVKRRGLTYLISVSFSAETPTKAASVANVIAKSYIDNQLRAKVSGASATRDILGARISDASAAIASSEAALGDYVFANIDRISSQTGNVQLTSLTSQLANLEKQRQKNILMSSLINRVVKDRDWSELTTKLGLNAVADLEQQRRKIVDDLSRSVVGEAVFVNLQYELVKVEKQMEEKAKSELTRLSQSRFKISSETNNLKGQIRVSAISSDLPADMVTEIFELQQNAEEARTQYQGLLSRLREVETQVDLQVADSRIVSAALPPERPSFPNNKLVLALAGLIGVGIGIGLAFLNEHYIGGFTTLAQVEAVLTTPVLAVFPKLKGKASADGKLPTLAILNTPLSSFSENVRRLRIGIEKALPEIVSENRSGRVILVCSAVPSEGKTTAALSLARTYALSGKSTLLIDADMRRPSLQKELGIADINKGLMEVLSGLPSANVLSSAIVEDKNTDLQILVGSKNSKVPTDQMFASNMFKSLMAVTVRKFDIVILDSPPVGPVVDALYLAQYADFLVFVVRWASTSQNEVRAALSSIKDALPDNVETGIVLNLQEKKMVGYQYSSYDGYYEEG
ncbi:MAG: AAA family ATPase [Hyphomicrobiales bacterium]|nr:AAA family ATPase [Hyphomicrobiales bacterium]